MTTLLFADPGNADELALEMQVRNAARVRVRSHTSAVTAILLEALPGVRARLGAIWGGRDPFLPARGVREALLRRFDPDVPIHIVEGAGHWVPYEGAEPFNRCLLELLDRRANPWFGPVTGSLKQRRLQGRVKRLCEARPGGGSAGGLPATRRPPPALDDRGPAARPRRGRDTSAGDPPGGPARA